MPSLLSFRCRVRPLKSLLVVVICLGMLVLLQVSKAQVLRADYQFQNTRSSSVGNSALTDSGSVNTFQQDTVDGSSRTVLRFPLNIGVRLKTSPNVLPFNSSHIVMLLKVDHVTGL